MGVDVKGGGNAEEFLGLVPILKDDMVLYQPSVEFVWHEPIYGGGAIVVLLLWCCLLARWVGISIEGNY